MAALGEDGDGAIHVALRGLERFSRQLIVQRQGHAAERPGSRLEHLAAGRVLGVSAATASVMP